MSVKANPYNRPTDERFFGDIGALKPNMASSTAMTTLGAQTVPNPYVAATMQTRIDAIVAAINALNAEVNIQRTAIRNT